jgi:phosphoglycolate phosphatase-like HAD superfamily hydrolase
LIPNQTKPSPLYDELKENPDQYLQENKEMLRILTQLRAKGKQTFLATNKPREYVDFVLEKILGKEWQTLFDIVVIKCRKPLFQRSKNILIPIFEMVEEVKETNLYKKGSMESLQTWF